MRAWLDFLTVASASNRLVIIAHMKWWRSVDSHGPAFMRFLAEHPAFDLPLLLSFLLDRSHQMSPNYRAKVVVND